MWFRLGGVASAQVGLRSSDDTGPVGGRLRSGHTPSMEDDSQMGAISAREQIAAAIEAREWQQVQLLANALLSAEPRNPAALAFRALASSQLLAECGTLAAASGERLSFAAGRYQVCREIGQGRRKTVFWCTTRYSTATSPTRR